MTARGAALFIGGAVSAALWTGINGWLAALAYCMGLIVGPCVYTNRAPWKL